MDWVRGVQHLREHQKLLAVCIFRLRVIYHIANIDQPMGKATTCTSRRMGPDSNLWAAQEHRTYILCTSSRSDISSSNRTSKIH
eukprot:c26546_g1_i1 orf=22-273(-)